MNSTRNIMALIETLLADGGELGVRELGMRTGIPKSTVQRFLSGMEENGWVAQDKRTQGYRIGYKLLGQSNGWALRPDMRAHRRDARECAAPLAPQAAFLPGEGEHACACAVRRAFRESRYRETLSLLGWSIKKQSGFRFA